MSGESDSRCGVSKAYAEAVLARCVAPELVAFVRCAVDVRSVDVEAASASGVLVTRASPGFVALLTELVVGMSPLGQRIACSVSG